MFQVIGGDDDRGLLGPLRDIPIASLEVWKRRKGKNLEANSNNPTAANQRRGKKDTYTTDDALFFVMELNNAAKSGGPNLSITNGPCRSIKIKGPVATNLKPQERAIFFIDEGGLSERPTGFAPGPS